MAILKVMDIPHLHTTTFRTILDVLFEVRIHKHMILPGKAVHHPRPDGPYLFATAGNLMTVNFGIGDLLQPITIDTQTQLWRHRILGSKVCM